MRSHLDINDCSARISTLIENNNNKNRYIHHFINFNILSPTHSHTHIDRNTTYLHLWIEYAPTPKVNVIQYISFFLNDEIFPIWWIWIKSKSKVYNPKLYQQEEKKQYRTFWGFIEFYPCDPKRMNFLLIKMHRCASRLTIMTYGVLSENWIWQFLWFGLTF